MKKLMNAGPGRTCRKRNKEQGDDNVRFRWQICRLLHTRVEVNGPGRVELVIFTTYKYSISCVGNSRRPLHASKRSGQPLDAPGHELQLVAVAEALADVLLVRRPDALAGVWHAAVGNVQDVVVVPWQEAVVSFSAK